MKSQLPKWLIIFVTVSLALGSASGSVMGVKAAEKPSAAGSGSLKLAILAPLTGPVPTLGRSARDGALLAITQQNAGGGILGMTVDPLVEDTACNATTAVNATNKVISQDGVRYIIGDVCSKSSIPMSEITNAAGVVQMTPTATHPGVTVGTDGKVKEYVFRACFLDPFQGKVGAQFAKETWRAKSAFILLDQSNDYVKNLADAFERTFVAGSGQIVGKETYTSGDTDFSAILAKVADAKPDMVYLPDYYNIVNLVTKQAKEKGIAAPFMGGDGWDSADLDKAAAAGGFFTNHFSLEDSRPEVRAFEQAFRAAYSYPPDAIAALAYDSARLLFQAMHEADTTDTATVKTKLAAISFQGVTGSLIYDGKHNPIKSAAMMQVNGDGVHFYALVNPPSPALAVNYPNGSPGSYFTFTGTNFPAGKTAAIIVNGHTVTDTLPVDDAGGFVFRLSTTDAGEGRYSVTASVNPKATAGFTLDATAPLRPSEGSGPEIVVPAGIAYTKILYLPLVRR